MEDYYSAEYKRVILECGNHESMLVYHGVRQGCRRTEEVREQGSCLSSITQTQEDTAVGAVVQQHASSRERIESGHPAVVAQQCGVTGSYLHTRVLSHVVGGLPSMPLTV